MAPPSTCLVIFPSLSTYPSTNASESEFDHSDSVSALTNSISALTVDVPIANAPKPKRRQIKPFRFVDLPGELRLKIYGYHFTTTGEVLDLETDNYKRIHKPLCLLRTCRQVYSEASYLFYSTHTFRIFPIYGKFFRTKKPLLARMKPGPRACLTTLQLRLGPGWNRPPRGWVVNDALGLKDCINVRRLKVFVECDPSNDAFKGFRAEDGFYEGFSQELLRAVLDEMPWCEIAEFDANPSVKKSGAMMTGLLEVACNKGRRLAWGPEKGWDDGVEKEEDFFSTISIEVFRGWTLLNFSRRHITHLYSKAY
ncbi:uncharacterized protein BCR38DRAFT_461875 [Pseudomassariella vexata]|uniref:F-box domain-containing protein n=1 Tax=Pseudomassariella vexata TaxID=1141098 RepID=A0A1Y2D9W9_9PEZI|nr:uncharacterized protein BCR38DRAFT_461875 [Pseudomassariella vexata]ORY55916.1 hypothetical protein BCR38DRAFT_461875 [Pseudomassariella vexata]